MGMGFAGRGRGFYRPIPNGRRQNGDKMSTLIDKRRALIDKRPTLIDKRRRLIDQMRCLIDKR